MRPLVICGFIGLFLYSCSVVHKVEIGLDQTLSMPEDSYVLDYMNQLFQYLAVGAPVYFVVPENLSNIYRNGSAQKNICSGIGCSSESLVTQITTAGKMSEYTRIAPGSPMSWLDDYIDWVKPGGSCCGTDPNNPNKMLPPYKDKNSVKCRNQDQAYDRLIEEEFDKYLPWFLGMNPSPYCAKGGHAAYSTALEISCGPINNSTKCSDDTINNQVNIGATHFMTYHTQSKTSTEFTDSLVQARKLADQISEELGINAKNAKPTEKVYAYSIFYVFYEQYLTIVNDTIKQLAISIFAVGLMTFFMLGCDITAALIVVFTLCMLLIDMFGVMYLWDISLRVFGYFEVERQ